MYGYWTANPLLGAPRSALSRLILVYSSISRREALYVCTVRSPDMNTRFMAPAVVPPRNACIAAHPSDPHNRPQVLFGAQSLRAADLPLLGSIFLLGCEVIILSLLWTFMEQFYKANPKSTQ